MDTPNVDAPEKPAEGRDIEDLVNAIWRSGWEAGHKAGFRLGHQTGRSVMNNGWVVFAVTVAIAAGILVGYTLDFVHTCMPIAIDESKSCVTRVGE